MPTFSLKSVEKASIAQKVKPVDSISISEAAGGLLQRVTFLEPVSKGRWLKQPVWEMIELLCHSLRSRSFLAEELEILLQPVHSDALTMNIRLPALADEGRMANFILNALDNLLNRLDNPNTPISGLRFHVVKFSEGKMQPDYFSLTENQVGLLNKIDKLKQKYGKGIISLSASLPDSECCPARGIVLAFDRKLRGW